MVKSPEEYLSTMSFETEIHPVKEEELNPGERAFIEKYIGLDALKDLTPQYPEPEPLPEPVKPDPQPLPLKEPEIIVTAPITLQIKEPEDTSATRLQPDKEISAPLTVKTAESAGKSPVHGVLAAQRLALREKQRQTVTLKTALPTSQPIIKKTEKTVSKSDSLPKTVEKNFVPEQNERASVQIRTASEASAVSENLIKTGTISAETKNAEVQKISTALNPVSASGLSPEALLKEKMKQASEVQVVSFYVAGQLFLLPVEGIQEVVRHMELIKVPQPPAYIAGAINLRGTVMPLVRLSTLLTNEAEVPYNSNNFVIITGTEQLRMGLIIDKVNSMHMIPQKKIIWNAESKLGESAEFLSAIVDLDDRVCGMVAPENIVQKILPEL